MADQRLLFRFMVVHGCTYRVGHPEDRFSRYRFDYEKAMLLTPTRPIIEISSEELP